MLPPGVQPREPLNGVLTIRHIAWSPDGITLAVGHVDGSLCVWDVITATPLWKNAGHPREVEHLAWSPDGAVLASTDAWMICLWDGGTGQPVRSIEAPAQRTAALAWSADGRRLTSVRIVGEPKAERTVLTTWDAGTGETVEEIADPAWDRCDIGTSADRRQIAVPLKNGTVQIWELGETRLLDSLPAGARSISALALSPDRRYLVLAPAGGAVDVWDLRRKERIGVLGENERTVYSLTFSADGEVLAGKSRDGTVRLWLRSTWSRVGEIDEKSVSGQQVEIAFAPCGGRLATFDRMNKSLRLWEINVDEMIPASIAVLRILFLAANPLLSLGLPLRLDLELRRIQETLELAKLRDRFELFPKWAVRPHDFSRALHEHRPHIVHFSGHGEESGVILMEGNGGEPHPMMPRALANLFGLVSDQVLCVILNACYSRDQARAIAKKVKYVVGMRSEIEDNAATAFSVGFYQALGHGRSIDDAFRFGCAQIDLWNVPGHLTPVLWKDGKVFPHEK
ncbi:MAG TPA: CHAT domain-containing protein [Thermoanaerobaculia bacterium]